VRHMYKTRKRDVVYIPLRVSSEVLRAPPQRFRAAESPRRCGRAKTIIGVPPVLRDDGWKSANGFGARSRSLIVPVLDSWISAKAPVDAFVLVGFPE
jgi:hypothetical protein